MSSLLFVMLATFLIEFSIYFVSTVFSRRNSFVATESHSMHHLERTDDKPFSRLIGPTHTNKLDDSPLKLVCEILLSYSAIYRKHLNTILYVTAAVFKPTIT